MAEAGANTTRRDQLLSIQEEAQARWKELNIFEVDAPKGGQPVPEGKFFGNFPYPYMNGVLHLGHAFSLSKLEFASAYHRLCGKKVLFPQGFHCTGMPIKACSDKLTYEITTYGAPPVIPEATEEVAPVDTGPTDPTQFKAGKSKAAAKKGNGTTQWQILASSGIPEDEVVQFQDPKHWLKYFPPLAQRDMTSMGCGVDWRRSFITTDANPYYDSFVRWQFLTLKAQGKVIKDKRFAVFSPKDGQPCADHDRSSGEGVNSQEYTLIKMGAQSLKGKLATLNSQGRVFLMAATLRPETMYGQTNCWVLPDGDYGAFRGLNDEIYIMCHRAARNLSFQDKTPVYGEADCLMSFKGVDLIGTALTVPMRPDVLVYVLPLLTISMGKGTGVVTSVPSDSPADWIALQDLKRKPKLREKFGVADEWVVDLEVIPIIEIEGFGNKAAEKVCIDLKVDSQNDAVKLEQAKDMVYLKGFTHGRMLVGEHAGKMVSEAKPLLRQHMIDTHQAIVYCEPEKPVVSRSGDECVVALTDQWYIIYGEEEWRSATEECLSKMELYNETVRNGFKHTLGWLNHWACSRSFGLGTWLPWDPEYLIESLSDSTVYMAYYTIAHILQQGDMYGTQAGPVTPEQMTPAVWDAIFLDKAVPADCTIPESVMSHMKDEFNFWYPFDLRVSGKDLIQNHLTFCLYNHVAIWGDRMQPKAVRTNGHLMLNSEKMSKSTGNFKTLQQSIEEYSADAMRVALADAGDSNDDANFEVATANAAILRLTKELAWIEEILASTLRTGELSVADLVFKNAICMCVHATRSSYDRMLMREALKNGWFELLSARDTYRLHLGPAGMHHDVTHLFIEVAALIMVPIFPHTADHIYVNMLKKGGCALTAGWPQVPQPDFSLQRSAKLVEDSIVRLRSLIQKKEALPKKKKAGVPPPPKVVGIQLYVATCFQGWREAALGALRDLYDPAAGSLPANCSSDVIAAIKGHPEFKDKPDKLIKAEAMPFIKFKAAEADIGGAQVLEPRLPYDEQEALIQNMEYLKRSVGIESIEVFSSTGDSVPEGIVARDGPFPAEPRVVLVTEDPTPA